KAIILAGGVAKRLKPVTNDLPKCMLYVGKESIIQRQIRILLSNNIKEIIIVTGFKSSLLKQHLDLNFKNQNIKIIKNDRYRETGPAYGLWCAREFIGKDDVLYLNGDLICDQKIIKKIINTKHESVTALSRNAWDEEQVKIEVNQDLSIKSIGKKIDEKNSFGEFIGITKISKNFGEKLI